MGRIFKSEYESGYEMSQPTHTASIAAAGSQLFLFKVWSEQGSGVTGALRR
jgi:hypothetical protein